MQNWVENHSHPWFEGLCFENPKSQSHVMVMWCVELMFRAWQFILPLNHHLSPSSSLCFALQTYIFSKYTPLIFHDHFQLIPTYLERFFGVLLGEFSGLLWVILNFSFSQADFVFIAHSHNYWILIIIPSHSSTLPLLPPLSAFLIS